MKTPEQILEPLRNRRRCEEALDVLRKRKKRSVTSAVMDFTLAVFLGGIAFASGVVVEIDGKFVLAPLGCLLAVGSWYCLSESIKGLYTDPRDRLLILFAEDYLARSSEPNNQSSPATVPASRP